MNRNVVQTMKRYCAGYESAYRSNFKMETLGSFHSNTKIIEILFSVEERGKLKYLEALFSL